MTISINTHSAYIPKTDVYSSFQSEKSVRNYQSKKYRYHNVEKNPRRVNMLAFIGSTLGTIIPMLYFAKKQNKKIYNINFGIKEMITISSCSIAGGVFGGIITSNKKHHKQKINEGVFQCLNATIPPLLVFGGLKILNKINKATIFNKIATTLAGLALGIPIATILTNKINDPFDKVPDRKLTLKDSVANIDDAFGALALAKVPYMNKIPFEKIIPGIYTLCGYRAGQSN